MTSIFEVSHTPAHKSEKAKGGKYVGWRKRSPT